MAQKISETCLDPDPLDIYIPLHQFLDLHAQHMTIATVIFKLVGFSIFFLNLLLYVIFSLSSCCAQFLLLCMKGVSCTCMPLTSTLTLHPPFEKSGYGLVTVVLMNPIASGNG